jgi:pSer/pThr/pTyr-binding forkhead associated (FHA) protein
LNSTNGTYVNGKIVKKHALQHGDVVTVGHHALRFVDGDTEEPADEFERTMLIKPRDAAAMLGPAATPAPTPSPALGGGAPPKAKLQVLSGQFAGRELELVKTLTTLGRPGVQVAAITRRADGYYIVHVESGREGDYPLVNGTQIGPQARRLHDNDVLQLAGVKMGFFAS